MADYIVQKAVAPDKVKKKLRRTLDEYGQTFDAFNKYDGCCVILNGVAALSRTGEVHPSLSLHPLQGWCLANKMVIVGEAWWPGKDQFNLISGEFRRQVPSDKLFVIVHDILTHGEFHDGHSSVGYSDRMARATAHSGFHWEKARRYPAGTYGCPQQLCNELADEGGYDGLILRDPEGTWTVGSGTTGEIVKIKRELSFDLRVLEVNTAVGEKTGRTVYKLVVDFQGKHLGVGSGVPHDPAAVPEVGDIVEVVAMDYSSDGLLREPRFKGVRFDKTNPD